jgi:hypothetical protein
MTKGSSLIHSFDGEDFFNKNGLTKREYFAAMAMQGICTPCIAGSHNANNAQESQFKAEMAVRLADALIAELNKEKV